MGYDLETSENGKDTRLSKLSHCWAEDENDPHAVKMEALPNLVTYSKYAEGNACLESDSEGSEEATVYKSCQPVEASVFYTQAEEASVIRSFDRRLVLFIALLYMLSFLDRSSKLYLRPWIYC